MGAAQLAGDELAHLCEALGAGRIGGKELLSETHGADGEADGFLDALALGEGDFTAAAAEVDEEDTAAGARLGADDAVVNEAAFFEAGDDLHLPAGFSFDPGLEGRAVAGVAHGGGGDDADAVSGMSLHGALKAFEGAEGGGHGFRGDEAGLEDAGAEARDLAVLVEGFELMGDDAGNLEPAGVGTDVDGGKGGHAWGAGSPGGEMALWGKGTRRGERRGARGQGPGREWGIQRINSL